MFPNMSEVLGIVFSIHALEACLVNLMPQKLLIFSDVLGLESVTSHRTSGHSRLISSEAFMTAQVNALKF